MRLKIIEVFKNKSPPELKNKNDTHITFDQQVSLGFTLFGKQVKTILGSTCLKSSNKALIHFGITLKVK